MTVQTFGELIDRAADFIADLQLPSGAIPWYKDGVTDPWDHIECAIALDLCGRHDESTKAYEWLRKTQNPDGSWWYYYQDGLPKEMAKDSNHSSYVATGVWHHYLLTKDMDFLRQMWPVVDRGINYALGMQQPNGVVWWARDYNDEAWPSSPLTASSCICQSLLDGIKIARELGLDKPEWDKASQKLSRAIREKPELFDTAGDNRRGYAMNWYYPVLMGIIDGDKARERIKGEWEEFIVDGWGCKCSLDQPWVTVAETCEVILALVRIGELQQAKTLLDWVMPLHDSDGGFWTGVKVPEGIVYPPDEKTTWTSAGVILAVAASTGEGDPGNTSFKAE